MKASERKEFDGWAIKDPNGRLGYRAVRVRLVEVENEGDGA